MWHAFQRANLMVYVTCSFTLCVLLIASCGNAELSTSAQNHTNAKAVPQHSTGLSIDRELDDQSIVLQKRSASATQPLFDPSVHAFSGDSNSTADDEDNFSDNITNSFLTSNNQTAGNRTSAVSSDVTQIDDEDDSSDYRTNVSTRSLPQATTSLPVAATTDQTYTGTIESDEGEDDAFDTTTHRIRHPSTTSVDLEEGDQDDGTVSPFSTTQRPDYSQTTKASDSTNDGDSSGYRRQAATTRNHRGTSTPSYGSEDESVNDVKVLMINEPQTSTKKRVRSHRKRVITMNSRNSSSANDDFESVLQTDNAWTAGTLLFGPQETTPLAVTFSGTSFDSGSQSGHSSSGGSSVSGESSQFSDQNSNEINTFSSGAVQTGSHSAGSSSSHSLNGSSSRKTGSSSGGLLKSEKTEILGAVVTGIVEDLATGRNVTTVTACNRTVVVSISSNATSGHNSASLPGFPGSKNPSPASQTAFKFSGNVPDGFSPNLNQNKLQFSGFSPYQDNAVGSGYNQGPFYGSRSGRSLGDGYGMGGGGSGWGGGMTIDLPPAPLPPPVPAPFVFAIPSPPGPPPIPGIMAPPMPNFNVNVPPPPPFPASPPLPGMPNIEFPAFPSQTFGGGNSGWSKKR